MYLAVSFELIVIIIGKNLLFFDIFFLRRSFLKTLKYERSITQEDENISDIYKKNTEILCLIIRIYDGT